MALDNVPIEGDDYRWKSVVERKIRALESRIARLEGRIASLEGRVK